ncbi:MAG: redoxin domain-containing protein, partial [Bernardetiaceae bacterium]|nr:redoxin domain-containing protein [Bernardetiaceae bacterium]
NAQTKPLTATEHEEAMLERLPIALAALKDTLQPYALDVFKVSAFYRFVANNPTQEKIEKFFAMLDFQDRELKTFMREQMQLHIEAQQRIEGKQNIPDFLVLDLEGNLLNMSEHISQKATYINFWFPSCSPCLTAVPAKNELFEDMANKEVEIIHICTSGGEDAWKKAIKKYDIKGTHFYVKHEEVVSMLKITFNYSVYPHYSLLKDKYIAYPKAYKPNEAATQILGLLTE